MNYYEELGLERTAPPEEIRRAYKKLARVLHPDACQDEQVRRIADCQLKRLNAIVAVLSDAERRRAYDRTLASGAFPDVAAEVSRVARMARAHWVWLAAALGLGAIVWFVWDGGTAAKPVTAAAGPQPFPAVGEPVRVPRRTAREEEALRKRSRRTAPKQEFAGRRMRRRAETAARAAQSPPPQAEEPAGRAVPDSAQTFDLPRAAPEAAPARERADAGEPASPPAEAPASPRAPTAAAEDRAQPAASSGWAGSWLYARSSSGGLQKDLYPPKHIELKIRESGGEIQGRYRAEYLVSDRPISPEVSFTFAGPVQESQAELTWSGSGGARGKIRLDRFSETSMGVTWWTTTFGKGMDLASGTAVLIRLYEQ